MSKEALQQQLAQARKGISKGLDGLGWELNAPQRIKLSIRQKPLQWIGGGAVVGFFLSILFRPWRRSRSKSGAPSGSAKNQAAAPSGIIGALFGLIRLLVPLLQPAATEYIRRSLPIWINMARERSQRRPR